MIGLRNFHWSNLIFTILVGVPTTMPMKKFQHIRVIHTTMAMKKLQHIRDIPSHCFSRHPLDLTKDTVYERYRRAKYLS